MSSIAIWYTPESGTKESANLEIHLNYWKIPNPNFKVTKKDFYLVKRFKRHLDIGLKIEKADVVKEINIFVPNKLKDLHSEVSELGEKISSDTNLLCSIFNKELNYTNHGASDYCEVTNSDGDTEINIYKIPRNKIKHRAFDHGTIFTFNLEQATKAFTYIRIRIEESLLKGFFSIESPANSKFQGLVKRNETFDLRINEIRALNPEIVEEVRKMGNFVINKLHLFFICCSRETYQFSHKDFMSCRTLEENVWSSYLPELKLGKKDSLLAYHWKEKETKPENYLNEYSAFIKTLYERSTAFTLLFYIFLVILIGLGVNFVDFSLKKLYHCKENPSTTDETKQPIDSLNNKNISFFEAHEVE